MASEDKLVQLFDKVVDLLIERVQDPGCSTNDLKLAAQIVAQTGIKCIDTPTSKVGQLRQVLPFPGKKAPINGEAAEESVEAFMN